MPLPPPPAAAPRSASAVISIQGAPRSIAPGECCRKDAWAARQHAPCHAPGGTAAGLAKPQAPRQATVPPLITLHSSIMELRAALLLLCSLSLALAEVRAPVPGPPGPRCLLAGHAESAGSGCAHSPARPRRWCRLPLSAACRWPLPTLPLGEPCLQPVVYSPFAANLESFPTGLGRCRLSVRAQSPWPQSLRRCCAAAAPLLRCCCKAGPAACMCAGRRCPAPDRRRQPAPPNHADITAADLDGAEIHKAGGAQLKGLALAGVTVGRGGAGRRL